MHCSALFFLVCLSRDVCPPPTMTILSKGCITDPIWSVLSCSLHVASIFYMPLSCGVFSTTFSSNFSHTVFHDSRTVCLMTLFQHIHSHPVAGWQLLKTSVFPESFSDVIFRFCSHRGVKLKWTLRYFFCDEDPCENAGIDYL